MDQLFEIMRVTEKEADAIEQSPNEPHSHDFEELIIGMEGELEHFIDFRMVKLQAPFVCFVTSGKIHRVTPRSVNGKCDIWALRFKSEFIPETTFQLYSLYHDQANIAMESGSCFNRLATLSELIYQESKNETPDYAVIRHLLSALFTMVEAERRKQQQEEPNKQRSQNITFRNFLRILEENFRRPEGVDFYAEKLFMSARNLNNICQHILQKSVTEIIETRKLIEAKNLLVNTDKTVSEIGFELGYSEKSYFTSVFKKRTGQTPTEFRDEMCKLFSGIHHTISEN